MAGKAQSWLMRKVHGRGGIKADASILWTHTHAHTHILTRAHTHILMLTPTLGNLAWSYSRAPSMQR